MTKERSRVRHLSLILCDLPGTTRQREAKRKFVPVDARTKNASPEPAFLAVPAGTHRNSRDRLSRDLLSARVAIQCVLAVGDSAVKVITCPLENFDATDVVALRGVRSYVASLPIGRDWAGTERAADRTCETCQRRSFQNY